MDLYTISIAAFGAVTGWTIGEVIDADKARKIERKPRTTPQFDSLNTKSKIDQLASIMKESK